MEPTTMKLASNSGHRSGGNAKSCSNSKPGPNTKSGSNSKPGKYSGLEKAAQNIGEPNTDGLTFQLETIMELEVIESPLKVKTAGQLDWTGNIFIMDDDDFNLDILSKFVKRCSDERDNVTFGTTLSSEYSAGLDHILSDLEKGKIFDVVITDYYLESDRTGAEFVTAIKAAYAEKNLLRPYFILISGDASCMETQGCEWFDECIEKPIIFRHIQKVLVDFTNRVMTQ
jgi:CheY-like chemotaxis protein